MTNLEYIELLWSDFLNGTDSFSKANKERKYNRDYYFRHKENMTEEEKERHRKKQRDYYENNKERLSQINKEKYLKRKSKS